MRDTVRAGGDPKKKGDGERLWQRTERDLWSGIEQPEEIRVANQAEGFRQAQSALAALGAMRG